MKKYYSSNYLNVYDSHRDTCILFNGFTGAIDEVSVDLGSVLKQLSSNGKSMPGEITREISTPTLKFLRKRGHINTIGHKKEVNFFKKYVDKLHAGISSSMEKEASLMIVPSYNCNLACNYCYQNMLRKGEKKCARTMTTKQVDFIFEKLLDRLFPKVKDRAKISIMLYGGEPFMENHRPALDRIFHYTKRYQMKVSAITNTTRAQYMLEYFGNDVGLVNSIQVSFDGDKKYHNRSRIGLNKAPTFDTIVNNIHKLINKRVRVGIRMNVSKDSVPTMPRLLKRLKKEKILGNPLVHAYAWVIHSHYDQASESLLISPLELADFMNKNGLTVETPVGRREKRLAPVFEATKGIPLRRTAFCMKCLPNSFVYDSYNNIYSCYEEAGHPEKRAGFINDSGKIVMNNRFKQGLKRHVATIEECSKCSLALTCGGGCPFSAKNKTGTMFSSDCDCHKECVEKAVRNLFRKKVEIKNPMSETDREDELYPYA